MSQGAEWHASTTNRVPARSCSCRFNEEAAASWVACVEANFKMRPDMSEVVRRMDEVAESLVDEGVVIIPIKQ